MAAGKYNISMDQGATFQLKLTIKGGDPAVPLDITSWTFAGKIRKSYNTPELAAFSFDIQDQITNTGEVVISMSSADTGAIPAEAPTSNYVYDIEATNGGSVTRILQGAVSFSAEITK